MGALVSVFGAVDTGIDATRLTTEWMSDVIAVIGAEQEQYEDWTDENA